MADCLTVVGWLWHPLNGAPLYAPKHVNAWARMIHDHLTIPHCFRLFTDQPFPYDPLIGMAPLWNNWRALINEKWGIDKPQCYLRLKAFSEEARELIGERFVSIDLDCLVVGSLDSVLDRDEDFLIWLRVGGGIASKRNPYQGSMWMMNAGARPQVWEKFNGDESVRAAAQYMGTDQAWMRHILGPDEKGWTQKDGVYKWQDFAPFLQYETNPPPDARIIFFPGETKPWHPIKTHPWIREQYNKYFEDSCFQGHN